RLLSVMANCPSKKKPSRGVVAIQFGLPRPAFRNAACVRFEVAFARLISSSLISKGLKASNFFRVKISAIGRSRALRSVETTQTRLSLVYAIARRMIGGLRRGL